MSGTPIHRNWPQVTTWEVQSLKTFNKHRYSLSFDYSAQSLHIQKIEAKRGEQKQRVVAAALVKAKKTEKSPNTDIRLTIPSLNFQKFFRFAGAEECKDFLEILEAVQISKGRAFRIFNEVDSDENGILDTEEMKTTMQRMGLPTDNMEMVGSLVSFEEFIRFFIAGVKQTASRCASDPMLQPLSSTDKPEDAKDTSSLSSTGSAISTLATSIFSKTGTPLGESKSSMQGQNRFKEIIVPPMAEPKLLFHIEDNKLGNPQVIIGTIDPRSSLVGRLEKGMGLLCVNDFPVQGADHARKLINESLARGFKLMTTPSRSRRNMSLITMVNALMHDNQVEANRVEVDRYPGEKSMHEPCSAMILEFCGNTNVRAGIVEVTNYRVAFMENSSGLVSEISHGEILKVEERPASVRASALASGRAESEITITSKQLQVFQILVASDKGVAEMITALAFPKTQLDLFASTYSKHRKLSGFSRDESGWNLYDAVAEYKRLGLSSGENFRLTTANCNEQGMYRLSPTYPVFFCVPSVVSDEELFELVKHRSKGRIPATVYMHPITGATLSRCAQPISGIGNKRSKLDEKVVASIRAANPTNSQSIYLMDARPFKAAVGNKVMGKGFEDVSRYKGAEIEFLNIDNIHKIRQSFTRCVEACASDSGQFHQKLTASGWIYYVQLIIGSARKIARILSHSGASVIVHCSDGWDRTAQLTSLVEILIDPFYRTRQGFAIIVEKEWLSFGHKFAVRLGHASAKHNDDQRSPIFLQFLDCVWQITRQFPDAFEFNERFLLDVAKHSYSGLFGTFLFNHEKERHEAGVKRKTESIWTVLCAKNTAEMYQNPLYRMRLAKRAKADAKRQINKRVLFFRDMLEPEPKMCSLWERQFLPRQNLAGNASKWANEAVIKQLLLERRTLVKLLAKATGKDHNDETWQKEVDAKVKATSRRWSIKKNRRRSVSGEIPIVYTLPRGQHPHPGAGMLVQSKRRVALETSMTSISEGADATTTISDKPSSNPDPEDESWVNISRESVDGDFPPPSGPPPRRVSGVGRTPPPPPPPASSRRSVSDSVGPPAAPPRRLSQPSSLSVSDSAKTKPITPPALPEVPAWRRRSSAGGGSRLSETTERPALESRPSRPVKKSHQLADSQNSLMEAMTRVKQNEAPKRPKRPPPPRSSSLSSASRQGTASSEAINARPRRPRPPMPTHIKRRSTTGSAVDSRLIRTRAHAEEASRRQRDDGKFVSRQPLKRMLPINPISPRYIGILGAGLDRDPSPPPPPRRRPSPPPVAKLAPTPTTTRPRASKSLGGSERPTSRRRAHVVLGKRPPPPKSPRPKSPRPMAATPARPRPPPRRDAQQKAPGTPETKNKPTMPQRKPPSDSGGGGCETAVYTIQQLQNAVFCESNGVDTARKEAYLSDEDIEKVFKVPRSELARMPEWRKKQMKRTYGLF